jgi:hypothetical protein
MTFQTRLNFYVTIFLAALIPQNEYTSELLDSLYMNAVFYGLALLITVLVQSIQGQLDLYHAIFVMHMVACLSVLHLYGMTCVPMWIYYRVLIRAEKIGINRFIQANRFGFKMKITFAIQVLQVLVVFTPWSLYVWIKDSGFGSQPECNNLIKYVVLFISVRATVSWLRIMSIIGLATSALTSLIGLGAMLIARKDPTDAAEAEPSDGFPWFTWTFSVVCVSSALYVSRQ